MMTQRWFAATVLCGWALLAPLAAAETDGESRYDRQREEELLGYKERMRRKVEAALGDGDALAVEPETAPVVVGRSRGGTPVDPTIRRTKSQAPATRAQIADRLATRRLSVDFEEAPLEDVLRLIGHQTGINVILNPAIDAQTPVTLHVNDMTAKNVLKWVMELTGYYSEVRGEALYVTDKKSGRMVLHVYPIADLVRPATDHFLPYADDDDDDDDGWVEDDLETSREKLVEMVRRISETEE